MTQAATARIAVDIGGTFTDVVLETPQGRSSCKVLTTIAAPEQGVLTGIERVLAETGIAPASVSLIIHGTTLATNALIERKGAVTAFVTTEGFRDILEMGMEQRFAQYDVYMDRPPPLVPRPLRLVVPERISADGRVLLPLRESAVADLAAEIEAQGAVAVAIGLMNAYAHPQHERALRALLAARLPATTTICLSSEVSPEMREYERFSTTVANAYIRPLMARYLHRLADDLKRRGLASPLLLMMSGGGLTTLDQAARFPIRLVESGPAGGAILAARIAAECALDHVVAFDMGGTTAKVCLIDHGQPERARSFEVARSYRNQKGSGMPLRIPVIDLVEIGAGGGSIARVDALKRITVGPDSAGADPGPACYGRGGSEPTVTDANLALGRIDPARFAGGHIALDAKAGDAALRQHVGDRLALDGFWSAVGVSEIVEENMANAARVHAIERGRVISRYAIIAFGGGAPLHAGRIAQKLGVKRVVVPAGAGVGSAIGFLCAPVSYEVVRTYRAQLDRLDLAEVNAMLDLMRREARAVITPAAGGAPLVEQAVVDARYSGQGHELTVTLPPGALTADSHKAIRAAFEAQYKTLYNVTVPGQQVELVTWAITISTAPPPVVAAILPDGPPLAPAASHRAYDARGGEARDHAVYSRDDIAPGQRIAGPAIIMEAQTATIVPSRFSATVNTLGHIIIDSEEA